MEILTLQKEYSTDKFVFMTDKFVFPGRNGGPLGARALFILLRSLDVFVTVHGFRASFRNWCAHTRQDRDLSELSLGHTVKGQVESAYWTDDMLEQRRIIMEAWASYCG